MNIEERPYWTEWRQFKFQIKNDYHERIFTILQRAGSRACQ